MTSLVASGAGSSASLQGLPQEIRDYIYALCLVSSEPIVVWSGHRELVGPENWVHERSCLCLECPGPHYELIRDRTVTSRSCKDLTFGLLRCNHAINDEAGRILYSGNTFKFEGHHHWDPVVSWLRQIGARNRTYLKDLSVDTESPMHVHQNEDGSRGWIKERGGFNYEIAYPRNEALSLSPDLPVKGIVENINPAIESIFALLGSEGLSMTLHLDLEHAFIPGVQLSQIDNPEPEWAYFGLDLPKLIEAWRVKHCTIFEGHTRVEVLWEASCFTENFAESRHEIELISWDILNWKELPWKPYQDDSRCLPLAEEPGSNAAEVDDADDYMAYFSLKWQGQRDMLLADGPYPYSWRGK